MTTDMPPGSPGTATGASKAATTPTMSSTHATAALAAEIGAHFAHRMNTIGEGGAPMARKPASTVSPAFLAGGAAIQYDGRHPAVTHLNTSELTIVQDAQIRRLTDASRRITTTVDDNHTLLTEMRTEIRSLKTSMRVASIICAAFAFTAVAIALSAFNAR